MLSQKSDDTMLEEILEKMGLDPDLAKTFIALSGLGLLSAGDLAKNMGIPRASLYGYLRRLHEKGFVKQTVSTSGVKFFAVEPPEKIDALLRQKVESLEKIRDQFGDIARTLQMKRIPALSRPKFEFFEGEEGVRHVLKDMLLYRDLSTSAFWPIKTMLDVLSPDFFRYMNKERIRRRLFTRALWPEKEIVDIAKHPYLGVGDAFLREIRVAPRDIDCSMGYWIYGDKVAFVSSQKERFAFLIESAELVKLLLTQFEVIWGMSKPLEVDSRITADFLREIAMR